MTEVRIASPRTLTAWKELRDTKPEMIYYSSRTCWWTADPEHLYCQDGQLSKDCGCGGIPLDPAGAPLFMADDLEQFIAEAKAHEKDHYGPHGLDALILAYHGNVVSEDGLPRCAVDWDTYGKLLDGQDVAAAGILADCDLTLRSDITQESEHGEVVPCWFVGWQGEQGAGLVSGGVTIDGNFFWSEGEAASWIVEHETELRAGYGEDAPRRPVGGCNGCGAGPGVVCQLDCAKRWQRSD